MSKKRDLPSWMERMGKEGDCRTRKVQTKAKKTLHLRVRPTVYFMNESELVQSALLFGDLRGRKGLAEKVGLPKTEDSVVQEGGHEAGNDSCEQDAPDVLGARTCVSESYLDTAQLDTLPYCTDQGHKPDTENCKASTLTEPLPDAVSDDDPLKLVKEIFFT